LVFGTPRILMEIEAKFVVPDATVARKLRAVEQIDTYSLSAATRFTVRDTFFDTRANDLLSTRHVLRVRRRSDGSTFLTFKAPSQKNASDTDNSSIHRRPETEVKIPQSRTPRVLHVGELPPRIQKLVAPLVHDDALYPMFSTFQTRDVKLVRAARRIIAEWSVDFVKFRAGARRRTFYELEVELKKTGQERDLEKIGEWLEREFQLQPSRESKFARALQFMRGV
jgi:inorganic triphosphatase YgiF